MATYSSSANDIRLYLSLNWLRDGSQEEMLSKWLAVGESRTIGGRSLRQKSVAVAAVMENVMKLVGAPCWWNTLETLPRRKSKFPTLSGREQRVREGPTNKESNHRG